ncbi:MAG: hypothetical protein KKC68_06195 [Candidatus Thermoplasmatota archaeon]|nr:hypothetical protein [Candidatus Thermoplasmatota archaeon]MBU1941348.1 hypothetical protein [Candidatus Thermoplasmatota archaeon]
MKRDDNIYVKLVLDVHFDKDAPNFYVDDKVISWCPTPEEITFINESVQKISQHQWTPTTATTIPPAYTYPTTTQTPNTSAAMPKAPAYTQQTPSTPQTTSPPTTTPRSTPTSSPAAGLKESTVDILLKRKKDEKDQKVAFVP